ncbi:MAG TPA: UDP-N-acetylglucosamine pyrophosphorylase [Ruminococcus sp.]|nr:UDP-N-acetylglucosamine pyrophosphorylase [Ruminococcus sp.]
MIEKTLEMLAMLNQAHIAKHMRSLALPEQRALAKQIAALDLTVLSLTDTCCKRGSFAPPSAVSKDEIRANAARFRQTGISAIRAGKVGAVLLAGGQGTRLGFDRPKGMYNMGQTRELSIFECLMNNLMEVTREADAWVPLFIMTSVENGEQTQRFFEEHDYFGYSRDNVWFFEQEELPTVDKSGKLMLADRGRILTAPNGNGGWYASMERAGMLKVLHDTKIEWLNVFAVDNVLQRIADPCFIGAVIESGKRSGAKVVAKAAPEEKVGVLCMENGKPSIIEYFEMSPEMAEQRDENGELTYRYGVILNYLFRTDRLDRSLHTKLPLHRAYKKIRYMTPDGKMVLPEAPNAYKFETLALDMVKLQDDCLAYEVDRRHEFAPVKNKEGVDSVDTARALLRLNGITL